MSSLESVPGAGVLVDREYTITDGNDRCQVVFKEDFDQIRGNTLQSLQSRGLFDGQTLRQWERAVTATLDGSAEEIAEQITLRPAGSDETFVYDLRVTPATATPSEQVCCSLRSVGTGQRYDETITALHVATRELMAADDVEEVLRRTAEAASDVLGFPGTAVRSYDERAEMLRHVAFGARVENIDTRPPYHVDESPHGRAIRQNQTIIDDIDEDADPYDRGVFTQTMYIPIGRAGLLSIGAVGSTFDETDVQFAEILAENAAAAIRLVDTTTTLRRERERLDRFASVVSHDLRNPLGIAQTYLDFAEETGDPEDFAAVREAHDRMETMIESLLTMARTETEIDDPEQVPLGECAASAWETTHTEGATLEVSVPDGVRIDADPDLLSHVFENLYRNSVEHGLPDEKQTDETPSGATDGSITVRVGTLEDGFYVEDDGAGIAADERSDVLEDGYSTSEDGTGLGLSIVKDVVDAHDWSLSVAEGSEGGARFEITVEG